MKRTLGVILVRARTDKLKEMFESVSNLYTSDYLAERKMTLRLAAQVAGSYDALILIECERAYEMADFVLTELRTRLSECVADTQTYIAWEMVPPGAKEGTEGAE